MKLQCVAVLLILVQSCGSTSNLNKVIFGADNESVESLLVQAQLAFDKKEYDKSAELSQKVLDMNPKIGDAASLLGFSYLGQVGVSPMQLARKLVGLNSKTPDPEDANCTSTGSADSALDTLKTLACKLLKLSDSDYEKLGEAKQIGNGTGFFTGKKIFLPYEVTDTLRGKINVLNAANKGVKGLCGFVERSVLSATDERHQNASCAAIEGAQASKSKIHFVFAILHLTETLVFQASLLSDSVGNTGTTNVQALSSTMNAADFGTDIAGFATASVDLKDSIDQVFNVTSNKSQVSVTLSSLKTVSRSFGQIPGIPPKVTAVLNEAVGKIEETSKRLGGSTGELQVLKAQVNKKIAQDLGTKIDKVITDAQAKGQTVSEADKTKLCGSYTSLATGSEGLTKPTICP